MLFEGFCRATGLDEATVKNLMRDNFNRRMKPFLEPLVRNGEQVLYESLRGRPATLYRVATRG